MAPHALVKTTQPYCKQCSLTILGIDRRDFASTGWAKGTQFVAVDPAYEARKLVEARLPLGIVNIVKCTGCCLAGKNGHTSIVLVDSTGRCLGDCDRDHGDDPFDLERIPARAPKVAGTKPPKPAGARAR